MERLEMANTIIIVGVVVLAWIFGEQYRMVTRHEVDDDKGEHVYGEERWRQTRGFS